MASSAPGALPLTQISPKFRTVCAARVCLTLKVGDLVAAVPRRDGVHHAEHTPADHDDTLHPDAPFSAGGQGNFRTKSSVRG